MSKKRTGLWPTPSAQSAGEGELIEKATDAGGNKPKRNQRVYNPDTGKHIQVSLNRAVKIDWQEDAPPVSNQLTLLPEDSLASLTVLPGSEEAQQMTATSGRNISALLERSDRDTSLERTFLESSPPISTRCYLTWKVKATPASRLIYQLSPSMPPIDENGSSLWRTPHASDGEGGVMEMRKGAAGHYKLRDHVQEKNRDFWPTPQANEDAAGTVNGKMQRMLGNHPAVRESGSGTLNPTWVEWLMGFPPGWTDLEDSETP